MTNDELNAAATAFLKELYADIGEEMPQLGDQQQATAVEEKPEPKPQPATKAKRGRKKK